MKKLFLLLIALFLLAGCATTTQPYIQSIPDINERKSAGIGDVFFEHTTIAPVDPMTVMFGVSSSQDNMRFDLTILELNEQKIGLQYSEYTYYSNPSTFRSGWAIREGFNKRFDYVVADKTIRFKGYEFEILGVEQGKIQYRRIK